MLSVHGNGKKIGISVNIEVKIWQDYPLFSYRMWNVEVNKFVILTYKIVYISEILSFQPMFAKAFLLSIYHKC